MSPRRRVADDWPFNLLVKCKKCDRQLLNYHAWHDADDDGPISDDRWEPADARRTTSPDGAKFHFTCRCGAKPQLRYDKVAQAASPYGQAVLKI